MSVFSDESLLLLRNWDTVQDILEAHRQLQREFSQLLFSLESELAKNDWWQDGWVFVRSRGDQVYISNRGWLTDDTYLVWIGVERFAPENLLGPEAVPTLYVWVPGGRRDLAQQLAERIAGGGHEVLGEIDQRASGYVVRESVRTFLPEEAEDFAPIVHKQILDFFCHYAKVIGSFDALI
jgi:hypothetical protein